MKAAVLYGINDLKVENAVVPELQQGEALVKIKSAGICGSDIPRIFETGTYSFPLIPGHEFSGVVTEIKNEKDREWINRRVGIFPLIPCGKCRSCRSKHYEMCSNYSYLGSRKNGGFAEYVAVPVRNLIKIPDGVSYEQAAMLEPMAVAVHAMRKAGIDKNDRVVICGLGTVGMLLLMFLKEAGVENILGIGNKDFQKIKAIESGMAEDDYCDSRTENVEMWLREKTHNQGADVFFECVGTNETLRYGMVSAAPLGRVILVGNPRAEMSLSKEEYWRILRNQLSVQGCWNSSFTGDENDDWHYVLKRLCQKTISPERYITHRLSLREIMDGLQFMKNKTEDYLKIMILPDRMEP